jgi:peptidoglycan/LPS O-acetylase OafA/YrhL
MYRIADPRRLPGLDVLRAVAIGWVLVCHLNGFALLPSDYFGWMGVDLFFVLSGFLIGGQLFRPIEAGERPDYSTFAVRRLLRTLPTYLVVLAVYVAAPALWDRRELQPAWQFLTFTQNLLIRPGHANSFSQAWSLCVEEQFYLALPLALLLIGRRATPRIVMLGLAALVAAGMALRGGLWLSQVAEHPWDPAAAPRSAGYMRYIYYPTWTRLDGLLAGVSLALLRTFRPEAWARLTARPNLLLAMGVIGVGLSIRVFGAQIAGLFGSMFGFPLVAASMALLVAGAGDPRSVLSRAALPGAGALAAVSYSLYLSHKMVFHAVIGLTAGAPHAVQALTPVLALAAALVVGFGLYLTVERPVLRLREAMQRGRRPIAPVGLEPAE